jgi:hypothetical protein
LRSTVELFTVKDERKARTLAEWLGGLLGLYNTVKVEQIEHKEDSTRDALKTARWTSMRRRRKNQSDRLLANWRTPEV